MLYIVATPIGNLKDITLRALKVLKEADLILCEDTRQTKKLLEHYQIKTPCLSYHHHSKLNRINYIAELLNQDKSLALVSDAGTPCVSDPGSKLIDLALNQIENLKIIPIPGPAALIAAASISGFSMERFLFLGFLPRKKHRQKILKEISESRYAVIFYESPYRVLKTLEELKILLSPERRLAVCRELSKKFETIYRGNVSEIIEKLKNPSAGEKIKGEFAVIIDKID
ncbi:MAG: 16S rRNA (cytidine1402-2'-O)-methyltransferase [Parcubacteria group bacterium Athens1014_10]|nr:MAG: 16S rRNA (cytidine1402-2'-O)-methyltransferase [Parcubacteria group bacterium Athens1014_10]TSD05523.1 MAG: 16S rRNA (cytidine1402-2'-O)-methyltransferase [Parcubacteria group bacterium Athens0714_12]